MFKTSLYINRVFIILLAVGILCTIYLLRTFSSESSKNIIASNLINWSKGFNSVENKSLNNRAVVYRSNIGGSEFSFRVKNTKQIRFDLEGQPDLPSLGLEIWVDNKYYDFPYPDFHNAKTAISIEDNIGSKAIDVRGRVYCAPTPRLPCDLRINQIQIDDRAELLNLKTVNKRTMSVLGDSISVNYGNNNYTFLLADKLGVYLLNASYHQSTMSNSEKGFMPGVIRVLTEVAPYKPDLVIISLGTNDLYAGINQEVFKSNYDTAVSVLVNLLPSANIIALGILKRTDFSREDINLYTNIIKQISKKYQIAYIDTYDWLEDKDFSDGLHPLAAVQPKIAEKLFDSLKELKIQ